MRILENRSNRGVVALSTLLISVILLILISALLRTLQSDKHSTMSYNRLTESLYVAEAGIADATLQISKNNAWAPTTPLEVTLPNGGKYTIVFDDDGTVEEHESVNNLANYSDTDGPRGTDTVPARTADVVVTVETSGRTERFEVLISRGLSEPVSVPILASGKIDLKGAVEINGIESLNSPIDIETGIHSNSNDNETGIISWDGLGTGDAFINGEVSVASTFPTAVTATGGDFNTTGVVTGGGSKQFPRVDVDLAVLVGRYATPLAPTGGGTTVVQSSDHIFAGGVIDGDLELRGVNLYVDGDLEVNGTIKGSGAIYVTGHTYFRGDSDLGASDTEVLSLFSKGNVKLEGFDGSQYLEAEGGTNPAFQKWYDDAQEAHEEILDIISVPSNYTDTAGPDDTWGATNGNELDQWRMILGEDDNPLVPVLPPGREGNTLGKMADYLETNYGGSETADFLVKRLRSTRQIYENKSASGLPPASVISNFLANSNDRQGVLDALNDGYDEDGARQSVGRARLQDFDRLGSSYFQGVVYSTGAVYASNEVKIVGALLSERRGSSDPAPWDVNGDGSVTLEAGDVFLAGGSSLTYNRELLEDPFAGSTFGPVTVTAWLGR